MGSQGTAKVDQRAASRICDSVRISLLVVFGRDFMPEHEAAHDLTLDISEGGLSFFDEWGLPENVLLEIRMQVAEDARPIVHYGRVRWRHPAPDTHGFTVGVEFVEASQEDRRIWLDHVKARRDKANFGRLHLARRP